VTCVYTFHETPEFITVRPRVRSRTVNAGLPIILFRRQKTPPLTSKAIRLTVICPATKKRRRKRRLTPLGEILAMPLIADQQTNEHPSKHRIEEENKKRPPPPLPPPTKRVRPSNTHPQTTPSWDPPSPPTTHDAQIRREWMGLGRGARESNLNILERRGIHRPTSTQQPNHSTCSSKAETHRPVPGCRFDLSCGVLVLLSTVYCSNCRSVRCDAV
jgi:hypothetical protein